MSPRVDRRTLLALVTLAVIGCACTGSGVDSVSGAATGTDPVDGDGDGGDDGGGDGGGDGDGGQPSASPETMVMIGDSITFMSIEPLQAELSDTGLDVLAIDAQVGRRITAGDRGQPYPGTDIVEFIANSNPPDLWVIALGTNDIGQYADAGEFGAQVQTLLDLLPAAAPLVWVDTFDGDRLDETRLVNDTLRAVVGARDNAVIVDWFSHGDDEGVVTDDAFHPTPDGILVFGQVVADGVDALLSSL